MHGWTQVSIYIILCTTYHGITWNVKNTFSFNTFSFSKTGVLQVVADMFGIELLILTVNKVEPTVYQPLQEGAEIHGRVILAFYKIDHYTSISK